MYSWKHTHSCLALLALIAGLAGCGGVSANGAIKPTPSPTPSPTGTPSPTPSPSPTPTPPGHQNFVFGVVDFEADGFFGGKINSSTGQITRVNSKPIANPLGQNIVVQLVVDPKGRFLYALDIGASSFGIQFGQIGISAFQINQSSGMLAPAPGQMLFPVQRFGQLAMDGSGRFLYQPDGSAVDIYTVDQSTGQLTAMAAANTPAPPVGGFSATTNDGKFLINEGNGQVMVYTINSGNGQLMSATTPMSTGGSGGPIAVSADSAFLYVANSMQGTVAVFSIATNGALTLMAGSPFSTDVAATGMALSPSGKFLFITLQNGTDNHVTGFAVNPAAGTFMAIPGATVAGANSVNIDGSGKFAYISQGKLATYKIDPLTGALTPVSQTAQPFTDIPSNIVLSP
jgi:6-phosphogluconolactonase (cycloisomerase 2 family)